MENKGLLFIPDISGFTKFVTESEINHSRLIIQELLEVLINSNEIGLQISEIEGDAILFYRFGEPPALEEIYKQVEKMFCSFHERINSYDHRRYCLCRACTTASTLTLKVITHYGEFTGYNVQQFNKLIGKDIIVAHQLLKNEIATHEYWLVTDNLVPGQRPVGIKEWMEWNDSEKETENGNIHYHFTLLSPLRQMITQEPTPRVNLDNRTKVVSATREYPIDFITLFHATGDFAYRHQWKDGVKKVEMLDHHLPRVGMRCITQMDNGTAYIYSSSYYYSDEKLEFSETNETDRTVTYYTIDILDKKRSKLTIDYYLQKGVRAAMFKLFQKKKVENSLQQSMVKLGDLATTLVIPL